MIKYLALLIILVLNLNIFAQNLKVTEYQTEEPIPNVQVSTSNQTKFTDKNGEVFLSDSISNEEIIFTSQGFINQMLTYDELKANGFKVELEKNIFEIDEITVSANRWEQRTAEVPISIVPVNVSNIDFTNPQTAADLLGTNDRVFIQKSQLGGGSPMLRGFAANRVLIVVDGVRMNNAIFRSGNLQNIISIDPSALDDAEVIFGPGSVIYGSDAIGGVMDFHTKKPKFAHNKKINFKLHSLTRYSTANQEKSVNIGFNIGLKKIAFYTNFSRSDFDDLKMGTIDFEEYTRPEYVKIIDNIDYIRKNPNINKQIYSGYSQYNFMQKVNLKLSKNSTLNYGFYLSETSDVPRYDRLIQYSDEQLKYAEWYYGPQKWMMNNLIFENTSNTKIWDNLRVTVAYQDYTESRHDRKLGKSDIRERTENVKLVTTNIDLFKILSNKTTLFYGFANSYNFVTSTGHERNIVTNESTPYASRYPDGSTYQNYDAYIQLKNKLSDKLILNTGLRYSYIIIDAEFDTTFYKFPFEKTRVTPNSLTGSTGLVYSTNNDWNYSLNLATGFRAPNIDDIGKVFDSEPGSVVVPNPNLKPEYIYDAEIGIHKTASKYFFNAAIFYSYLDNAMVRRDFLFNDQDSIIYDGEMSKVQALVNGDYAIVYGIQANAGVQIAKMVILKTAYNYLDGEDKEGYAIRHVPPAYGTTHLIIFGKKFKTDLYAVYNAEITNKNLTPTEQDKPYMYASDENGNPYCPSWWTLNLKTQYKFNDNINLNVGVENILDVRYRPYSSGIVAPGRNFIFSLRVVI